jgi:hypothetical protein
MEEYKIYYALLARLDEPEPVAQPPSLDWTQIMIPNTWMKLPEPKGIEIMWLPFERFIHGPDHTNPSIQFTISQYKEAWTKGVKSAAWVLPEIACYLPDNFEHIIEPISEAAKATRGPMTKPAAPNRKETTPQDMNSGLPERWLLVASRKRGRRRRSDANLEERWRAEDQSRRRAIESTTSGACSHLMMKWL